MSEDKKPYTVLLLRPEHIAETFGHDTYLAGAQAPSVSEAVRIVQSKAAEDDGEADAGDAYHVLMVCEGIVDDIKHEFVRDECCTTLLPLTVREVRTLAKVLADASMGERPEAQQRDITSVLQKLHQP